MNNDELTGEESKRSHPTVDETAIELLTGGLSEVDHRDIARRILDGDLELEAAVARYREVLARFAMTVQPVQPLPDLKLRLLASLPDDRREHFAVDASKLSGPQPYLDFTQRPDTRGLEAQMNLDADWQLISQLLVNLGQRMPPEPLPLRDARKALLVIDMLHDYVDEGSPMETPLARAIVPALRHRLLVERAQGTAIIYVNDRHQEDDDDFAVWPRHAVRGTRGAQIIPSLQPHPEDHVLHRVSYSAFFETELEQLLEELGVTDIMLTGQAADACVMMTAIDALMRGYRVEVPEDSVAGLTPEGKVFALRRIAMLKPYQVKKRR